MFRVHSCRFRNEDYKENCARMFIEREYGVPFSYCIECSQQAFIEPRSRLQVDFTEVTLEQFGRQFVQAWLAFGMMLENQAREVERKRQIRRMMRMTKQQQMAMMRGSPMKDQH